MFRATWYMYIYVCIKKQTKRIIIIALLHTYISTYTEYRFDQRSYHFTACRATLYMSAYIIFIHIPSTGLSRTTLYIYNTFEYAVQCFSSIHVCLNQDAIFNIMWMHIQTKYIEF